MQESADSLYSKISVLHDAGDLSEAKSMARYAAALHPTSAKIWALQGMLLYEERSFEEATVSFSCALKQLPVFPYALFTRGRASEELGLHEAAILDYLAAHACQPKRVDALIALARTLVSAEFPNRALSFLERAVDLDRTDDQAREILAIVASTEPEQLKNLPQIPTVE